MMNLILMLALSPLSVPQSQTAGIFETCIWPKCARVGVLAAGESTKKYSELSRAEECSRPIVEIAQIQPCIWPKCSKPELQLAQIQPCIWPKCARGGALALGESPTKYSKLGRAEECERPTLEL